MLFKRPKTLTASQAFAALEQRDLQLVDVREPRELAESRIPGAVHIPLGQGGEDRGA
jgi:rhodanese-related sulfurtransferase